MILIPILLFLAACWSFYKAKRQSDSGTTYISTDKDYKRTFRDSTDKFPIVKTGAFVFGCVLLVASIVITLAMIAER